VRRCSIRSSVHAALKRADEALYAAKGEGRDRRVTR
jgi:hypothetical protein